MEGPVASFVALCKMINIILAFKRGCVEPGPDELEWASCAFMSAHIAAYGTSLLKPKHHWQLDVPAQIRRSSMVLDAFVIERNHLLVKRIAEHTRNTNCYEQSVLSGVLTLQLQESSSSHTIGAMLLGRTAVLLGRPDVLLADTLTVFGVEISVGDMVCVGHRVGQVQGCAQFDGTLAVLVTECKLIGATTDNAGKYSTPGGDVQPWRAMDVQLCIAWRMQPDGAVFALRP